MQAAGPALTVTTGQLHTAATIGAVTTARHLVRGLMHRRWVQYAMRRDFRVGEIAAGDVIPAAR